MKKFAFVSLSILCVAGAVVMLTAARYEAKIRPNTTIGPVTVGGLTKAEAAFKLRQWWESEKLKDVTFTIPGTAAKPLSMKLSKTGLLLDDAATVESIPVADFWDKAKETVAAGDKPQSFSPKFKTTSVSTAPLIAYVQKNAAKPKHARVLYSEGTFKRFPETTGKELDKDKFPAALLQGLENGNNVALPLREGAKSVTDEQLAAIDEVVSEFTTHFPASRISRNTNIKLAASKINGYVLAPGEVFSFNDVVGRRTIKEGFKEAPVFVNGKHDMGVGGGICQVSSTLYNASLFGNLKIKQRHNHSLPVPYLPVGRDATVDYGSLDLQIENNSPAPIALSSTLTKNTLTFRILGKKDPGLSVKIVSDKKQSWSNGVKTVNDPTLPAGKKKVIEKGSSGHSIYTYRVVYRNGQEVAREPLGRSYYKGSAALVAVGTKVVAPATTVPTTTPVIPPTVPAGTGIHL